MTGDAYRSCLHRAALDASLYFDLITNWKTQRFEHSLGSATERDLKVVLPLACYFFLRGFCRRRPHKVYPFTAFADLPNFGPLDIGSSRLLFGICSCVV